MEVASQAGILIFATHKGYAIPGSVTAKVLTMGTPLGRIARIICDLFHKAYDRLLFKVPRWRPSGLDARLSVKSTAADARAYRQCLGCLDKVEQNLMPKSGEKRLCRHSPS